MIHRLRHAHRHIGHLRASAELELGRLQYTTVQRALLQAAGGRFETVQVGDLQVPVLRAWPSSGLAARQPLLLVHGFADRKETWLPLLPMLARKVSIIAPDLPGFGAAPRVPPERAVPRAQAKFLCDLLDVLGIDRAHAAGQSMGGAVVARMAHDFPQRIRSLSLWSAAGPHGLHPEVEALRQKGHHLLLPRTFEEFTRLMQRSFARRPPFPGPMIRYLAHTWTARHEEHRAHFLRMIDPPDPDETAPVEIRPQPIPTLVAYGADERIVHLDNRQAYVRGFPGARTWTMDGVGHAPQVEAPAAMARAMLQVVHDAS